jgi:hypothetical protein
MKSYPILVFLLSLFVDDALAAMTEGQNGLFVDHDALLATKRGKAFLDSLRQRVLVVRTNNNNLPSNLAEVSSSSHGHIDSLKARYF